MENELEIWIHKHDFYGEELSGKFEIRLDSHDERDYGNFIKARIIIEGDRSE